ncbi:hypothetical protein A7U60_g667 [Sanghuangporus baumii]|uniref:DUF6534 domain-containing protein n=1 Tax=Sanghuangporus baumii TaxID=108892 RepID=A0A9Q5NA04_SANBA|nr:hypothetical protein A7U60_g667 [Sanghuangporus baumii]
MSSADAPQPPLNVYGAAWGPPLIATFVAAIVYGISVLQTFYYYSHHSKRDGLGWPALVAMIFTLDSAAMGLFMYCVYYYSILSWGMPEMLDPDVKEFPTEYILTTFLAMIVQCFYINTIRALKAPIIVTILLFLTSLTAFVTGLILPVVQLKLVSIQKIVVAPLNHLAFNIARGTALACDLGIVVVLCWLFATRRSGIRRSNNMLDALIMFSVQRGVLQAIVQTGEVLAYAIKPDGLYFLPFHVIVSRIYCNSLLATLNSRNYVLSKGLPEYQRARKRRIDGLQADVELGNVRNRNRDTDQEQSPVQEQRKEQRRDPVVPPGLSVPAAPAPAPASAPVETSASRWASTMNATSHILSSFLEPPFLFTDESFALASRGVRSGTRNTNSVSMIPSISGSEMPVSRENANEGTEMSSSRFADSEGSMQDLGKAESMGSISISDAYRSGGTSSSQNSPITPGNKDGDAVEAYGVVNLS